MALAPVPTTATFRPARSWPWSQRAEWNIVPAKDSRPGSRGIAGRLSWPQAATSTSATTGPPEVSSRQRPSSKAAARTSVSSRGSSPFRSAHPRRYSRISACPANRRLQSVLRSKEKEYSGDGTSQAAPG